MRVNIDVIIPSFRLDKATLLPLLNLKKPENSIVHFYLVSDNPKLKPDSSILSLVDNETVFLLINKENIGASATRNRGIEAGNGGWILFLDDDIAVTDDLLLIYADAISNRPNEIGFIGRVLMPQPPTPFARAVVAAGSMSIFNIAAEKDYFSWGATANIMVNRVAIKDIRFSDAYPKSGGGEEVEFFLRVREANNFRDFKTLPMAAVTHPWWSNGKTDFTRFYRYGQGNSFLAQRNPQYSWHDFLDTPETLLITALVLITSLFINYHFAFYAFCFLLLSILIEYITTIIRVKRNTGELNPATGIYVTILRICYETGLLTGNLKRGRIKGIGERFSYEGSIKKNHFRLNRFKIIKLVLYLIALIILISLYYASR